MGSNLLDKAVIKPDAELRMALRWRANGREIYLSAREKRLLAEYDKQQCQSGTCGRRHQHEH